MMKIIEKDIEMENSTDSLVKEECSVIAGVIRNNLDIKGHIQY